MAKIDRSGMAKKVKTHHTEQRCSITATRHDEMLERNRPIVGVHDVASLLVDACHPLSKLHGIGDGSGQECILAGVRQQDDRFLPDNASLLVLHCNTIQSKSATSPTLVQFAGHILETQHGRMLL